MNKKKRVVLAIVISITALAAIYIGFSIFFQSHFCFGTTVDGISVGGCSAEKVEKLIQEEIEQYSLCLVERDGEEIISGESISLEPVFQGEVQELLAQQKSYAWIVTLFNTASLELEKVVSYQENELQEVLKDLACLDRQEAPVDATWSEYSSKDGYTLVPADYGTTIDEAALQQAVEAAVENLDAELNLDETGCYVEPDVKDDDAELLALIDKMNQYADVTITYDFGEDSEILDGDTIHTWLSVQDGVLTVDEEAVLEYVKTLAKKYNTAYQPKTLETSYGKTVTISNGSYGWRIDNEGEVAQILADLEEGASVEREPVYLQTANSHGENDYGDSYVEINLTAQHLFLYKNGKLVIETDFVSGSVAGGHSTHTGAFGLTYKTTNAVLRGPGYETPVTYWMPFNGDEGMHDATWRSTFGGNIYKTNGSHGCINLPKSAAKTIYDVVEKGYPVLVYTLPGTESTAVQQADAATVVSQIDAIGPVTLESETAISTARNLYDALPDSARGYVTNYDVLVAAEATLAQLKNEAAAAVQQ
jgi:hypothetical protein